MVREYILIARRSTIEQKSVIMAQVAYYNVRIVKAKQVIYKKFNVSHEVTEPGILNIYQLCFPNFISYG